MVILVHPVFDTLSAFKSELTRNGGYQSGAINEAMCIAAEYGFFVKFRYLVEHHGADIHYGNDKALRVCTTTFHRRAWRARNGCDSQFHIEEQRALWYICRYLFRRACDYYYMTVALPRESWMVLEAIRRHYVGVVGGLYKAMGRSIARDVQHIVVEMCVGVSIVRNLRRECN